MTEIDLKDIVGNTDNSRESAPRLQGLGYGLVEPGQGKPALFALALGTAEEKAEYCKLVERHDEGLVDLAQSIGRQGQLLNCRVRPAGEGKYLLTFGCRRALAVLYLHAASGGKTPAKVWATVGEGDDKEALVESAAENAHRLPPSLIDQARLFQRMKDAGMSAARIARVYPMGKATEQIVRLRLRLLKLPKEAQLKVHAGKMSQDAALKLLGEGTSGRKKSLATKAKNGQKVGAEGRTSGEEIPAGAEGAGADVGEISPLPAGGMRSLLADFVTRLRAFDPSDVKLEERDGLSALAAEARKALAVVTRRLALGRASVKGSPAARSA